MANLELNAGTNFILVILIIGGINWLVTMLRIGTTYGFSGAEQAWASHPRDALSWIGDYIKKSGGGASLSLLPQVLIYFIVGICAIVLCFTIAHAHVNSSKNVENFALPLEGSASTPTCLPYDPFRGPRIDLTPELRQKDMDQFCTNVVQTDIMRERWGEVHKGALEEEFFENYTHTVLGGPGPPPNPNEFREYVMTCAKLGLTVERERNMVDNMLDAARRARGDKKLIQKI